MEVAEIPAFYFLRVEPCLSPSEWRVVCFALEYRSRWPVPFHVIAHQTGLSPVTVRRACLRLAAARLLPVTDDEAAVDWSRLRPAREVERNDRMVTGRLRRLVFKRDRGRCRYCGGRASGVDHVLPRARGGSNEPDNLVGCCGACNSRKGGRTPEEAGMRLLAIGGGR